MLENPDFQGYYAFMLLSRHKALFLAAIVVCATSCVWPQDSPTALQIAEQLERHDQQRTRDLKHYESLRHYAVEYHGFSAAIAATMDVLVNYDSAAGKSFAVVSQSGHKFLLEKVLKRAIDSEREASQVKASTTLSPANYKFELVGSESVGGRPTYILEVKPKTESKFLYRGRVWVDGADFALVKMETEPAKSPSFWISRTHIHMTSAKIGSFWMPQAVRSETKVRVGGTAVMTIDYGTYRIDSNAPPG